MFVCLSDRDDGKIDLCVMENNPAFETLETTKGKLLLWKLIK